MKKSEYDDDDDKKWVLLPPDPSKDRVCNSGLPATKKQKV